MTSSEHAHIELIAGTPEGGGQDRAARALAAALDVPVRIVNIPGRGGANGWELLAARRGDPRSVAISSPTLITNLETGIAGIDDRDLTPLAHLCTEYLAFTIAAGSSLRTAEDLLDSLSQPTESVAIATERGNVNHIALGRVGLSVSVDASTIPVRVFDSARHALADVSAGGSFLAVVSAASTVPEVETGELRVVAVSSPTRLAAPFDAVPTWLERGVDCSIGTWRGLVGPPGLEKSDVGVWERHIRRATSTDVWAEFVSAYRWVSEPLGPPEAKVFLDSQRDLLVAGLRTLGLSGRG